KTLRENADKIPADVKQRIETKISTVKTALQGKEVPPIREAMQDLSQTMQEVGSAIYRQSEQTPPAGENTNDKKTGNDEGTVEGDFREV
ncbi:MAG: molecular chaperone DnaK, partial [Chloroflexota bacterium]|nr:molecular chaperone DnaK [Chloroflexota bacterium]